MKKADGSSSTFLNHGVRQLEYFVAVAEERHFTKAAQRLMVSQSGLSASVRALERELGAALFTRTTRSVELTGAGRALLDRGDPHPGGRPRRARRGGGGAGPAARQPLGGHRAVRDRWTSARCWPGSGRARERRGAAAAGGFGGARPGRGGRAAGPGVRHAAGPAAGGRYGCCR